MSNPNEDTKRAPHGRKQYLINPEFQLRFVAIMIGVAILTVLALYVSNIIFVAKFVSIGKSLALTDDHPFWKFIAEQKAVLNSVFLWTSAIIGTAIVVGGVFLSHRIAGPIHRMQTHLEDIAKTGKIRELSFRQGDFFPEMAQSINMALRRLAKNDGHSSKSSDSDS